MEKLYFNGDILTLEEELYVDAILIKDDKIYKLNSNENKFFIDCFLKYYNEEDIRKIISNKF